MYLLLITFIVINNNLIVNNAISANWKFPFFLPPEKSIGITFESTTQFSNEQTIIMQEELPSPIILASINYAGRTMPTIGVFSVGNNKLLGATTKSINGHWHIVINKRQDYERQQQRIYKFQVIIFGKTFFLQSFIILKLENIWDNVAIMAYRPMPCVIRENFTGYNSNCLINIFHYDGFSKSEKIVQVNYKDTFELEKRNMSNNYLMHYNLRLKNPLSSTLAHNLTVHIKYYDTAQHLTELFVNLLLIKNPKSNPKWLKPFILHTIYEKTESHFQLLAMDTDANRNEDLCYDLELKGKMYLKFVNSKKFSENIVIQLVQKSKMYDIWYIPKTDKIPIRINNTTGLVQIGKIDRDRLQQNTFIFNTLAYYCKFKYLRIMQQSRIIVLDLNDNIPKISWTKKSLKIKETTPRIMPLVNFQVEDMDVAENGSYTLKLTSSNNLEINQAFAITPQNGYHSTNFNIMLKNATYLDYENATWQNFELEIIATEVGNSEHYSKSFLNIQLLNRNDEAPIFEVSQLNISIEATLPINTTLAVFKANDADVNDSVAYSFLEQYDDITIDSKTGRVSNIKTNFDETKHLQNIVIIAQDTLIIDNSDVIHTTQAVLNIKIIDYNDETLILKLPKEAVTIMENHSNNEILTDKIIVEQYSRNRGTKINLNINWDKSYVKKRAQFVNYNIKNAFIAKTLSVAGNRTQFALYLQKGFEFILDYEKIDQIVLYLVAYNSKQKHVMERLILQTQNINDNPPQFLPNTLNIKRSVLEWANQSTIIGRIDAFDEDGTEINTINYHLRAHGETLKNRIEIDKLSGDLKVTGKIECDIPKIYKLTYIVTITDGRFNISGIFNIDIIDINNRSPQLFNTSKSVVEIYEQMKTGEYITRIQAYDLDRDAPHNTLQYLISTSNNVNKLFKLNAFTGALSIELYNGLELDRDNGTTEYLIPIEIHDNFREGDWNQLNTSIMIKLLDINDNAPKLPAKNTFKPEFSEADTIYTFSSAVLRAVDIDAPETNNSLIAYKILSIKPVANNTPAVKNYKHFVKISNEPETLGRLYIASTPKGLYGLWQLEIQAHDHGVPQQSSVGSYQLNIQPYNFKAPEILYPLKNHLLEICYTLIGANGQLYQANCRTPLKNLKAYDPDSAKYGEVHFILSSNFDTNQIFNINQINRTDAQLLLKPNAEILPYQVYEFNISAIDGGGAISTLENVKIIFIAINNLTKKINIPTEGYNASNILGSIIQRIYPKRKN